MMHSFVSGFPEDFLSAASPRDRAAALLALGEATNKVGRVVGVDGSTVRRWRQRPEFRADIGRVRLRLLGTAALCVADSLTDARGESGTTDGREAS
ncbi:hypothetical protein [Streptomyces sp. NBC_01530]|uniref:hypothetical protein n=1 Tax=Streptomyces sp. NBC_01530 TaxID=2903895 RepID=UPI0038658199